MGLRRVQAQAQVSAAGAGHQHLLAPRREIQVHGGREDGHDSHLLYRSAQARLLAGVSQRAHQRDGLSAPLLRLVSVQSGGDRGQHEHGDLRLEHVQVQSARARARQLRKSQVFKAVPFQGELGRLQGRKRLVRQANDYEL